MSTNRSVPPGVRHDRETAGRVADSPVRAGLIGVRLAGPALPEPDPIR